MGNAFWTTTTPFSSWSPPQRLFALIWPAFVLYLILKILVEKMWGKDEAVQQMRTRRAQGFAQFETDSDPSNLVGNARIVGGNESADQIRDTFKSILTLDLESLRKSLQEEKFNAYTVLCAYVWRAMKINKEINAITEVIREAFDYAEQLDSEYYRTEKQKKPLYGLPFSVKSNFFMKGYDVTCGLAKLLNQPKETTCPFVLHLQELGAVPFVLTNVPQGLLSYVSSNPLYGTTKNPWDLTRTPGGSSGGEAALLAAGGAAFGIGSDLAGSLRIPAAFCGLVTLKPTQARFEVTDTHGGLPGRGRLGLSFGFYTKNVKEQEDLLKLIIGSPDYFDLVPLTRTVPLKSVDQNAKKPVIGYFLDDGFTPVVPSNRRAVRETVNRLEKKGFECKEFKLQDIDPEFQPFVVANMLFRNIMPDNAAYMAEMYGGEDYDQYMKLFIRLIRYKQNFLFRFFANYFAMPLANLLLSERLACLGNASNSGLEAARQNQENTDIYKLKWIRYWKKLGIDALICPSFITPAQPFEYPAQLSTGAFLTGLFNLLDVPAGVVPVSPVTSEDTANLLRDSGTYGFPTLGDVLLKKQRDAAKGSEGLPNAVQVIALPNDEETVLQVMKLVEEVTDGVEKLEWKLDEDESSESGTATEKTALGGKSDQNRSHHCFRRVPAKQ
ncbi:unnamed protein product [Caenorhabditis sp. 36 PRJEB53466]|nr:unnamed protein product [Caenorhabditis sp. 36 PRJEB53466]